VIVEGDTYLLKTGIDFDAATFERDVNSALRAKDAARLERAAQLYRGDFFQNASGGEWHFEVRDRLRELYAKALTALARIEGTPEAWERLVNFDPLDEVAARNLMTALAQRGDAPRASRVFRRLTETLRRELNVEPEPETLALSRRLASR
jgi:DNA-binding SARP family transcriptional activator